MGFLSKALSTLARGAAEPVRRSERGSVSGFEAIVRDVAKTTSRVNSYKILGPGSVEVRFRSRRSSWPARFLFNEQTGEWFYRAPHKTANAPKFFGEAVAGKIRERRSR